MTMRVTWHGAKVKAAAREAAARGLFRWAEDILEQAKRIVPIERKTLLDSGKTDVDARNGIASVYFDTPYAVRQHEELTWEHDEGRQAKYLETPLLLRHPVGLRIMAEELDRGLS